MSTQKTDDWAFPGRVLVVDDKFITVQGFILDLTSRGMSVQFWDSKSQMPNTDNVRIVVLDLDLIGGGFVTRASSSFFLPAASILNKIVGPYVVIVLSEDYTEDDPDKLANTYLQQYGKPVRGFIVGGPGLEKGFDYHKLYDLMQNTVEKDIIFKMSLIWESVFDQAKDKALGEFVEKKFHDEMISFIKSIKNDVDSESSVTREFAVNMLRIVSRYMQKGENFSKLQDILEKILLMEGTKKEPLIPQLRMFYKPSDDENISTGDIFTKTTSSQILGISISDTYEIILTPACDFSQNKAETVLLCEGFTVDSDTVVNPSHPFREIVKVFKLKENLTNLPIEHQKQYLVKRITDEIKDRPRLYVLWNFNDGRKDHLGLCLDFQKVRAVLKKDFEKTHEKRICRTDSPFIEDMMHNFGAYSTRVGIPDSNTSPV